MDPYVHIFDTTLRDGEQSPGATMTSQEKLRLAAALSRLGVDVIEAGFPAASPDDLAAVRRVAETFGREPPKGRDRPPAICGLARAKRDDIDVAWGAVQAAVRPRIHTFLATSPIHREHKLRMSCADVLGRIRDMVSYARDLCEDVEFSAEDAGRTEPEFLFEAVEAAVAAGARVVNIPDTVGYTLPHEFGALIAGIRSHVRGIEGVTISVHCHDDLGLAVANTLAGIQAGARQAEVTINGIGERAGNASLEELVMALRTRRDVYGLETGVDTTRLVHTSQLVSRITGMVVQPNKAIVGANAFAHEAGIHQDGVLKHQATYEIMRPEDVGVRGTNLVLGKHSGRHAFSARLEELGYPLGADALEVAFARFKSLAERKKTVSDAALVALVTDAETQPQEPFVLEDLELKYDDGQPTAHVALRDPNGVTHHGRASASGPVEAIFQAIAGVVPVRATLADYRVRAVTEGGDALAQATVRVQGEDTGPRPNAFHGLGTDIDVMQAGARAYLAALNRMLVHDAAVAAR